MHLRWHALFSKSLIVLFLFSGVSLIAAQSSNSPSFDAVSIRPSNAMKMVQFPQRSVAFPEHRACQYLRDRVTCLLPLRDLLREAFQLRYFQLNVPSWMDDARYQVEATMPLDTSKEVARQMLQRALIEAFSMKYEQTSRMTPVYALVCAPAGTHLTPFDPEHPVMQSRETPLGKVEDSVVITPGHFFQAGGSLDVFAQNLGSTAALTLPVIDATGLTGRYVIDLSWKSSADQDQESNVNVEDRGIVKAAAQELGLILEKREMPLPYLKVDSANKSPQI
ncbi:TIGR03435 family protein [Silvibacterium sp.]|uniref:TIGR03435 family protein n=1 Tax=Silvibacterium sp. TaxID=1964179 RepID=UPI0039E3EF3B